MFSHNIAGLCIAGIINVLYNYVRKFELHFRTVYYNHSLIKKCIF